MTGGTVEVLGETGTNFAAWNECGIGNVYNIEIFFTDFCLI